MRLVIVGIALTVLLGIVAFVSRGHTSPAGNGAHNRGASQFLANVVFTLWVLAMAGGAVVFVYLFTLQKRQRRDEFRVKPLLTSLLFFAVVLIAMVFLFHHLGHRGNPLKAAANRANRAGKQLSAAERRRLQGPNRAHSPDFSWQLAAGIVALIVGASVTAIIRSHRRRADRFAEAAIAHELMTLVDETIDDLRAEADPRKAIIACYARMERILAVHGLPRRESEAPLEYLRRVLIDLNVTKPAVTKLTELFERAKFSHHEIDSHMKEEAIDALVTFRDRMRAIGKYEEPPPLLLRDVPGRAS
jgi:Domain of unknown function (DUF4129)